MRAYSLSLHRPLQLQCSQEKQLKKKIANVVSVQTGCESLLSISSPATAAAMLAGEATEEKDSKSSKCANRV